MKRNKFIVSIGTLLTAPIASFSKIQNLIIRKDKGFKIPAGEGRFHGHLTLRGVNQNLLDVKISGKDTDGDIAIFRTDVTFTRERTFPYIHHGQDEIFYVLEGSYKFQVGTDKYDLKTGDSIFLPRKVPHAWTQVSAKGKMNVIMEPAGKLGRFLCCCSRTKA